ncbi:MAG TPA: glycosyltransferase family 2 protein [Candidatus Anoxymicrobiaceae bacterium]|jgi:GT2 family glycosyltransferase
MKSVSVVVINYNGLADLPGCLESVTAQDHSDIELVIIDNASSDGSREWLREWAACRAGSLANSSPRLVENDNNTGFSPALNQGIKASAGELVMPLNTDVVLDESFISRLAARLDEPGVGSTSGKLLRFPVGGDNNVIDTVGHSIFRNRLAWNIGEGRIGSTAYLEPAEIWGTCGAAAIYSRDMLEDVAVDGEIFDEDFFAFWEDLDVDWRARLRGWKSVYEPGAVAWHRRGGAGYRKSLLVERHNFKNRYLMMIKNDSGRGVLRNLPGIVFTEVLKAGALLVRCPRALAGGADVIRLLPVMLRKRRAIQSRRLVPARDIEEWFEPFGYFDWIRRHLLRRGEMIVEEGGVIS